MLHRSTVESSTLDLLKELLAIPELKDFYLVGGTALSLKYGHRISVDLDLFSIKDFDKEFIISILEKRFSTFKYKEDNIAIGVFCNINNVKIDLVKHHYFNIIEEFETIEGIRMFGDKDIIAMKIFAILRRAQKKDFFDLAALLKKYSIKQMIEFYHAKYPNNSIAISIPQAITYFADADISPDPHSLNGETWESVKTFLQKKVREYLS